MGRVALFEAGIVQSQATVGTIAAMVWNPGNTSVTSLGALGSVPSTAVLKDVSVINTGTISLYVYMGSVSAATTTGVVLPVGGQMTIQGYSGTVGATTAGTIWAISGNNSATATTGSTIAGLASVASVA